MHPSVFNTFYTCFQQGCGYVATLLQHCYNYVATMLRLCCNFIPTVQAEQHPAHPDHPVPTDIAVAKFTTSNLNVLEQMVMGCLDIFLKL